MIIKIKFNPLTLLILVFTLLVQNSYATTYITVNMSPKITSITVNLPMADGTYFDGNSKDYPLVNGKTTIEVADKLVGLVTINADWNSYFIYVQAQNKITLNITEKGFDIIGSNQSGQMLLNKLLIDDTRSRFEILDVYSSANQRKVVCDSLKKVGVSKFAQLLNDKKINKTFYQYAANEMDMYYRLLLSTQFFFKNRNAIFAVKGVLATVDKETLTQWKAIYADINVNPFWFKTKFFDALTQRYASLGTVMQSKVEDMDQNPYIINIDFYKKVLKGKALAYSWANAIQSGVDRKVFEKEWIANYDDFKKQFPNSILNTNLKALIQKVSDYQLAQNKHIQGVDTLLNFGQINKLEDLALALKGKVSYIDLWATWCGPCKEEMQFSIKMHDQMEAIGVQNVYVSVDIDREDAKWRTMYKGLKLKGINLRTNIALHKDIMAKVPKFVGIPRYLIVNKEGKIVEWNAKRPSDGAELIQQLKGYINANQELN